MYLWSDQTNSCRQLHSLHMVALRSRKQQYILVGRDQSFKDFLTLDNRDQIILARQLARELGMKTNSSEASCVELQ